MESLLSAYLNQDYNIKVGYLWAIFLILQIPIFFVGRKASPSRDLLIEGSKYGGPLRALEMAPDGAEYLFKHWDEETKTQLRRALYWDFLFIPLYVTSAVLACLMVGGYLRSAEIVRLGFVFSAPVGGLFDLVENLIMLQVINGLTADHWLQIARVSTFCKFAFIGLAFTYGLCGLLSWPCVTYLHQ